VQSKEAAADGRYCILTAGYGETPASNTFFLLRSFKKKNMPSELENTKLSNKNAFEISA
jgi:hypothetical protein